MGPGAGRFSRSDRLRSPRDFKRVARDGRRWASAHFVVLVAERKLAAAKRVAHGRPRLGVTASRKIGGAVERNRVKRRVREWFRRSRSRIATAFEGPVDIVVIARRGAAERPGRTLAAELDRALGIASDA